MAPRPWAAELLATWFHELSPVDWFRPSERVDRLLAKRFERSLRRFGNFPASRFLTDRATCRAAILLFDQIPRNLYRDTSRAFHWDRLALELTHGALRRGWLDGLRPVEKQFLLMPLMHSEAIADQRLSVALFARHVPDALDFARTHHQMVARFGRFPHRNAALGRQSTEAERRAVEQGFNW